MTQPQQPQILTLDNISRKPTNMQKDTGTLVTAYPQPVHFANEQWKIFWFPDEPKVEKDIQDVLTNFTDAERHGVITTLGLFKRYEIAAGDDYWAGRFKSMFPRPEFHRMASVFTAFELAVHAPFYSKLNELLHLESDAFYNAYLDDPVLAARMKFLGDVINHPEDLVSLAAFSMVEGAILYSSFAYLKHFQSQGKNKLLNVVRGINFSVRDENIHSIAGAWAFRQLLAERDLTAEEIKFIYELIFEIARQLYEHECRIIDMVFEKGHIDGITGTQMKHFVMSRINTCLQELGLPRLEEVKYNPIADWFYSGITGFVFNDNFSGIGNSYHRDWDENRFEYKEYQKKVEKVAAHG